MGRKRKNRSPTVRSNSPDQIKMETISIKQEPELIIDDDNYPPSPEPCQSSTLLSDVLKSQTPVDSKDPWKQKCERWVMEQQQIPEPELPAITSDPEEDDEALMDHRQPLMDEPAKLPADTELPLRSQLKDFTEKQILHSVAFECEWLKCGFETTEDIEYIAHVEKHLAAALEEHREAEEFVCYWDLCDFQTTSATSFESHVHFHSYHSRIKTYGASLSNVITIPKCNGDSRRRNSIQSFRVSFRCEWENCDESYTKAQPFFLHTQSHVQDQFPVDKRSLKDKVICLWANCTITYNRCSIALEHMRKHSTERTIGCFTCGAMFVSRLKFIDHCRRQVEYQNRQYPCSECDKLFATRQLMIDHRNIHNKKVSCSLCPMKWPSRKALAYHIRYRHVGLKPFQCQICNHSTVTKSDLDEHLLTHDERRMFRCEEFGCDATYKCQKSLKRHVDSVHYGTGPGIYACDLCPNQYKVGSNLSKHLIKAHKFKRPPGYNRFIYRADRDGVFRLPSLPLDGENGELPSENPTQGPSKKRKQTIKTEIKPTSTSEAASEPDSKWTSFAIDKLETVAPNTFAIELKPQDDVPKATTRPKRAATVSKPPPATNTPQATVKTEEPPSTSTRNIDDFTVMKRYLREEKPVVISFEETDSAGSVIRSETLHTTEITQDNFVKREVL